jgi:spermidine synthase
MHLTFPIRGDKLSMTVEVKDHIAHHTSEFQTIDIYDTEAFGKVLFLDGHVQLAELDEHAYHESLVQIPLNSIQNPKRALVVGGGDGGVLRELVKHTAIEHIDIVEIDQAVIDVSREFLPGVSDGAFEDPRVHLHVADAFPYIKQIREPYDLIVMDSTDTYEGEDGALSEQLFTETFYRDCRAALSKEGFLVTQADNLLFCPYSLEAALETFSKVFPRVGSYQAIVPSFGGFSGFAWASNEADMATRLNAAHPGHRYLDGITFALAFHPIRFDTE